jgi:AmiR/NasT family two-component response regulator
MALNLYGETAGALDDDAVTSAALFAAHARVLLMHADSSGKAASLATALTTSRQIGTAIGILMNARRITADDAFELLRGSSQQLNRKLRDVALEVTETGTLPSRRSPAVE